MSHFKLITSSLEFKELLTGMCESVHSKEDYTLRYLMTEKLDAEQPEYIMVETYDVTSRFTPLTIVADTSRRYKDKAGADKHPTEAHFQELFSKFTNEDLFAKEPYIVQTKSVAGFDLDHKLV